MPKKWGVLFWCPRCGASFFVASPTRDPLPSQAVCPVCDFTASVTTRKAMMKRSYQAAKRKKSFHAQHLVLLVKEAPT